VVVDSVREEHPEGVAVFNLRVEQTHTYFVRQEGLQTEPVWVDNTCQQLSLFDEPEGAQSRYGRASQYPHHCDPGVLDSVLAKYTSEAGEVVDPLNGEVIPPEELTLDHIMPVVQHWNEVGRFASYSVRKAWYNTVDNLRPMSRSSNSRNGATLGDIFSQEVGPAYSN
jgi:hypothetical protein